MQTIQIPGDILCPNDECSYIMRSTGAFTCKTREMEYHCDNCNKDFVVVLPRVKVEQK